MKSLLRLPALALALVSLAKAQDYTFTTLAGFNTIGGVDGIGTAARFMGTLNLALDSSGSIYVTDVAGNSLRKVSPEGVVTTLAGQPGTYGTADGMGRDARFSSPQGVAVDQHGNVYLADNINATIRKMSPDGVVTTLAGLAGRAGTADGIGSEARFYGPAGVAVDASGSLYITEWSKSTIRKVTPSGEVTTFAGLAGQSGSADGFRTDARFKVPWGIAVDGAGTIYVADAGNNTIRKIGLDGTVSTLAGSAGSSGSTDGTGTAARFFDPMGIAVDGHGNLFVSDAVNGTVRKITPAGLVTTIAYGVEGAQSLVVDPRGNVYVGDGNNYSIKKVTPDGTMTTFAGTNATRCSVDGTGTHAQFFQPRGLAVDINGNAFVADSGGNAIRKVTSTGVVTTVAGVLGARGSGVDGLANSARFWGPFAVARDTRGDLLITEFANSTVREINPAGVVSTVAGAFGMTGNIDGVGKAARFNGPQGIAVNDANVLFVADSNNATIRRIAPNHEVTTFAGQAGIFGYADGVGADARFVYPVGLAFDRSGNLYVADMAIRKITPAGIVTTLAGDTRSVGATDGKGSAARFLWPAGVAVDAIGNVFVADSGNHTIRKITPDGMVTTVAGLAGVPGAQDGTGSAVRFFNPTSVAVDRFGNLLVADQDNDEIRRGVVAGATAPVITLQPVSAGVGAGGIAAFTIAATGLPTPLLQWQRRAAGTADFVDLSNVHGASGLTKVRLTISDVTAAMNGDEFRCVVDNGQLPAATSQTATLTVLPPPAFTTANTATFVVGAQGSFTIAATGLPTFSVVAGILPSWASLDSATGVLSGTPPALTASPFSVIIQAANGPISPATQLFTLRVSPGPIVTSQPVAQTINVGATTVLSVDAAGVSPLAYQWTRDGVPLADTVDIAGATTANLVISDTKLSTAGSFAVIVSNTGGSVISSSVNLSVVTPPLITSQPVSRTVAFGTSANFSVTANSPSALTYQWFFNGWAIAGATSTTLAITPVLNSSAGEYAVKISAGTTAVTSRAAVLGVIAKGKATGLAMDFAEDIRHANGNFYDQILLTGSAAAVTADPGQVTRISFVDLNDDIVQVEFSGAGTLSLTLDDAAGPTAPVKYNQAVDYMKGHASIVIAGADDTTNVSVFSVGRMTAVNQAVFRDDVVYDGFADIEFIAISSTNGKFGGVRTANASYFNTKGLAGIFAPGVEFTGPVFVGDISGADIARSVLVFGSASEVLVTGGDLLQLNRQPVEVAGIGRLRFVDGTNSHGGLLPARRNQARLEQNGVNVTTDIVVNPTP